MSEDFDPFEGMDKPRPSKVPYEVVQKYIQTPEGSRFYNMVRRLILNLKPDKGFRIKMKEKK